MQLVVLLDKSKSIFKAKKSTLLLFHYGPVYLHLAENQVLATLEAILIEGNDQYLFPYVYLINYLILYCVKSHHAFIPASQKPKQ